METKKRYVVLLSLSSFLCFELSSGLGREKKMKVKMKGKG